MSCNWIIHYWNRSTTPGEEISILKYYKSYEWVGKEVEKKLAIFSCSVGDLFLDVNYTTFDDKEKLLEEILRSREKFYRCKDIVYDIFPPKIVQLY